MSKLFLGAAEVAKLLQIEINLKILLLCRKSFSWNIIWEVVWSGIWDIK